MPKELVFAMLIGCPVQVPKRCLVVAPLFQISMPTMDQVLPDPFVQVAVEEFEVAAALAVLNVITVPPAEYPVPESWVMFPVAVGALVPSRHWTEVGAV